MNRTYTFHHGQPVRKKRKPTVTFEEAGAFTLRQYVGLLVLHAVLGLIIHQAFDIVATVHAVAVVSYGVWAAIRRRIYRVAYVAAYTVGAEILWRMVGAAPVYEYGKYALVLLFGVALLRMRRRRFPAIAILYFLLLLPSVPITFSALGFSAARQAVSGVLSGPLALLMGVWFFSSIRLTHRQLTRLLLFLLLPIFAVAIITVYSIVTAEYIHFTMNSNKLTSGGWGPNQVSSILGLGAFGAFLAMMGRGKGHQFKVLVYGLLILFVTQAALTFSRGGPYLAVGSMAVGSLFYLKNARARTAIIIGGVVFFIFFNFFLMPELEELTQNTITVRIGDTDPSGRDEIALTDVQFWLRNLIFGIGPGMSREERWRLFGMTNRDHTEYTRLVGEHGIFGFVAFLLMLLMALTAFSRARSARDRGFRAAALGWAFAYMLINGIRLAAPVFLFGLAFVFLVPDARRPARFDEPLPTRQGKQRASV